MLNLANLQTGPFPVKRTVKPKKKNFQMVLIRKVGNGFEVTNGSIKFQGSNRTKLLEMMDVWESENR